MSGVMYVAFTQDARSASSKSRWNSSFVAFTKASASATVGGAGFVATTGADAGGGQGVAAGLQLTSAKPSAVKGRKNCRRSP